MIISEENSPSKNSDKRIINSPVLTRTKSSTSGKESTSEKSGRDKTQEKQTRKDNSPNRSPSETTPMGHTQMSDTPANTVSNADMNNVINTVISNYDVSRQNATQIVNSLTNTIKDQIPKTADPSSSLLNEAVSKLLAGLSEKNCLEKLLTGKSERKETRDSHREESPSFSSFRSRESHTVPAHRATEFESYNESNSIGSPEALPSLQVGNLLSTTTTRQVSKTPYNRHDDQNNHDIPSEWSFEDQFKPLYQIDNDPERRRFLNRLFTFMHQRGTPINRIPIMAKQILDLYTLYKLVVNKGGLVEVINKKIWREITKGLRLGLSSKIDTT